MTKTVLILMGRSGSGKSTLEKLLVSARPLRYHKVVSVTTRPMREGEKDGVDYHFITDDRMRELLTLGLVAQYTEFADCKYASLAEDYTTEHDYTVLVAVPKSAHEFLAIMRQRFPGHEALLVYFDISEGRLRQNMLTRGDDPEYIEKRLSRDTLDEDFKATGLEPDYVVTDDMLTRDLPWHFDEWLRKRERGEV